MCRSWPELDDIRGKVLFVLVDKYGKYGPMYRTLFPGLRNGTFFVSQPGEGTRLDDIDCPVKSCKGWRDVHPLLPRHILSEKLRLSQT